MAQGNAEKTQHSIRHKSQISSGQARKGFTLAELIVSVAIAGILMLGMSVFFSSTFHGLFTTQVRTANTQKQYAINEIIRYKLTDIEKALNTFSGNPSQATEALFKNKIAPNHQPFSYIGIFKADKDGDGTEENYLALKDMMIFNKIHYVGNDFFADSGAGQIKRADNGNEVIPKLDPPDKFKNFSSFEIIENGAVKDYYMVFPDKNRVMKCQCDDLLCKYDNCEDLPNMPQLLSPTDITSDNAREYLYISDSGNGRVIKYSLSDFTYSILASPLKYPTGLAYYEEGFDKWLFVAETFNNKIRKINSVSGATYTVVGDGDDEECEHTARFCKLSMPTGVFADDNKHELFIADSGNNRILKIKDPGAPEKLTFEFILDKNYALDRIEFINPSWSGGGDYDENVSNLIGMSWDSTGKTFKSPPPITVFENSVCKTSSGSFYVNEQSASKLKKDDVIVSGDDVFTVQNPPTPEECREDDDSPSLKKWLIKVSGDALSLLDGESVYFSNPLNVVVSIKDIPPDNFTPSGFHTFIIKTYDRNRGLVETDYYSMRVGDGKLGTNEDVIEVLVDRDDYPLISFPTGLTNSYFANSGAALDNAKIVEMIPFNPKTLNPIDVTAFNTFDYISDFALAEKDADGNVISPMKFIKYNTDKLLELVINAIVDENTIQTYKLNANIPKP